MLTFLPSLAFALALHAPAVHGHVRGFDGEPVAGVLLNLFDANGQYVADTSSRRDGSYRFGAHPEARRVVAWLEGVEIERDVADEVEMRFQDATYFTLSVRALDPAGGPLADYEFLARGKDDVYMAKSRTDADGRLRLRCNHRVESFLVHPDGWRHVVMGPFEKDTEITVDLRDQGFFRLSGTVTDENAKPVAGASLRASDAEPSNVAFATTDAAGRYSMWANRRMTELYVKFGEYVRCTCEGPWEKTCTFDFDWRKAGLVVVSGRVLDAHGKPVSGAIVIPSSSRNLAGHPNDPVGRSGKDGAYRALVPARTAFLVAVSDDLESVGVGPWTSDTVVDLRPLP